MRNFLIFEKSIVYGKIIRKLKPKVPLEYTSLLMIINLTLSVLFKRIYLIKIIIKIIQVLLYCLCCHL